MFGKFVLYLWQVGPVDRAYLPKEFQSLPTNNRWVIETGGVVHLTRNGVEFLKTLPEWQTRYD